MATRAFTLLVCAVIYPLRAQEASDISSLLSLFSAHATSSSVRLNWSLEHPPPVHMLFRIYRGYEEVGQFSVLTEINSDTMNSRTDYGYHDVSARTGVTYHYKISAVSPSGESLFPVVISATPMRSPTSEQGPLPSAAILPGDMITLYVRHAGEVKLEEIAGNSRLLVNEELRPGIYEFEPRGKSAVKLRLTHNRSDFFEVWWPLGRN